MEVENTMKRVLCGRTPWSTKKHQRSADSWIDGWISDHGYESGNDMHGYPMIWIKDGNGSVVSAHKLDDYDTLCDEVEEALENSRSEKTFKDELDDIIDDHLGFVSDSEIAEMEGNNPFEDGSDDKDYEEVESQDDNIIYLDDYSEDEIKSMDLKTLVKTNKIVYHGVVYGKFVNICAEDVTNDEAIVDLPLPADCKLEVYIDKKKKFNKLTIAPPRYITEISIIEAGCSILDVSKCQCDELKVGSPCWNESTSDFKNLQTIILPASSSSCRRITFPDKAFIKTKISNIINAESITDIGFGCFTGCKKLTNISLSVDVNMWSDSFQNSNLSHVDWYGNVIDSMIKPLARSYNDESQSSRSGTLRDSLEIFFHDTPYHDEFVSKYVDPFLEEIGE